MRIKIVQKNNKFMKGILTIILFSTAQRIKLVYPSLIADIN